MESMAQIGRAAPGVCHFQLKFHGIVHTGVCTFTFTAGPVSLQQKPLGFSHPPFGEAKETVK